MTEENVQLTAAVVTAYVSNNAVRASDFPNLIRAIYAAFDGLSNLTRTAPVEQPEKLTASQIRKSITREHLISFEDGKPYKTLKRSLTRLGLSADEYRRKWGLPNDYPLVAPEYAERRSALAHSIGLGQKHR